jgi:hypothetical protein
MAGTLIVDGLNTSSGILSTQNAITGIPKAWVYVGGSSSPSVPSSFNVSSVTYISTGTYDVNFTNAFSNANYCGVTGLQRAGTSDFINLGFNRRTTADRVETWSNGSQTNLMNFVVFWIQP